MFSDDAERGEQSHTGSVGFGRVVGFKEMIPLLLIEAGTAVGNRETSKASPASADGDAYRSPMRHSLQCVDEQSSQHIPQQQWVTADKRWSQLSTYVEASSLTSRDSSNELERGDGDLGKIYQIGSKLDTRARASLEAVKHCQRAIHGCL
jgi:hypothetical protein